MLVPVSWSVTKPYLKRVTYLWSTDVFSRVANTTSLGATDRVDALVPGSLDQVLQLENAGSATWKLVVALSFGTLDIGNQHLDVPVAAKATFFRSLTDVKSGRMAVVGFLYRTVERRQLGEDGDDARSLILDLLLLDQAPVPPNTVHHADLGTGSKLVMEPSRHAVLPCIRSQFRALSFVS